MDECLIQRGPGEAERPLTGHSFIDEWLAFESCTAELQEPLRHSSKAFATLARYRSLCRRPKAEERRAPKSIGAACEMSAVIAGTTTSEERNRRLSRLPPPYGRFCWTASPAPHRALRDRRSAQADSHRPSSASPIPVRAVPSAPDAVTPHRCGALQTARPRPAAAGLQRSANAPAPDRQPTS